MKLVIFGLTVSSSWGNGHATLWRGLIRALVCRGHEIVFFERDVPYYARHRDLTELPEGAELVLYPDWPAVTGSVLRALLDADVALVTSYCPDARAAAELARASRALNVFYDLDTPITLERFAAGTAPAYLGDDGLASYDLVLSYTGGRALDELRDRLGASTVMALYGHVDPDAHHPVPPLDRYRADLSYLGTWAEDRQAMLERLLVEPARSLQDRRFLIGGAQYPSDFPWTPNLYFVSHVPPAEHPAFFSSSRVTLNVTRQAMAAMGFCPSGRLFEAAACGTAVLTDRWDGLALFFEPGSEILVASDTPSAIAALELGDDELRRIGLRARERTLDEHTSAIRARELETVLSHPWASAEVG